MGGPTTCRLSGLYSGALQRWPRLKVLSDWGGRIMSGRGGQVGTGELGRWDRRASRASRELQRRRA